RTFLLSTTQSGGRGRTRTRRWPDCRLRPGQVSGHQQRAARTARGRPRAARHVLGRRAEAAEPAAELAGQLWATAIAHTKVAAENAVAQEREVLQAGRATLDETREELEREAAAMQERAKAALQARDLAVARREELERLVRRLEGQLEESKALLAAADDRAKA